LVKLDARGKVIEERTVLAQLIQRNDLLKVQPGETIPTDGRIVDGRTSCDESLITGESMPVDKTIDAQVFGGTKNVDGLIIIRATHVGQETALKQIIRLVEDAQTSKAPIQQLADRIAGYFVPFIVSISLVTLIIYIILGFTMFDTMKKYSSVILMIEFGFLINLSYCVVLSTKR
jgi:Cu+-exporting ATPase